MLSGRQTLGSIEAGLRQLHDNVREIDQQIKDSSNELVDLQRQQAERFRRMAQIRMDEFVSGQLTEGLDIADKRAMELLRERSDKLETVDRQIGSTTERLENLEGKRAAARADRDRATEELDNAEAAVQDRLKEDADYRAQLETARRARQTAEHALEKTRQAEQRRKEKGQPYEKDPLFMYLWHRGYGTSRYSAGPLTRLLDRWVARMCKYDAARPNYAMLLEIPVRLDEHAKNLQDASDEEFIRLTRLEVEASEAAGNLVLKESADKAQAALDAIDDEIEQAESQLHDLERQRSRFANGEDEDFQLAVKTISDRFEQKDLLTLYEYARSTATPEDDILVREMEDFGERLRQAREMVSDRKSARERLFERLQELEGVRRRFKRNRFDSPHSEFGNDAVLGMALSQFLTGAVTAGELWRTIERIQRYRRIRSNPTFGSGGFQPRPGTWHMPFPRGGGLGGGLRRGPGGPGRGGGGFRTGGGF